MLNGSSSFDVDDVGGVGPRRERRFPSSDDIRAMVDAAFSLGGSTMAGSGNSSSSSGGGGGGGGMSNGNNIGSGSRNNNSIVSGLRSPSFDSAAATPVRVDASTPIDEEGGSDDDDDDDEDDEDGVAGRMSLISFPLPQAVGEVSGLGGLGESEAVGNGKRGKGVGGGVLDEKAVPDPSSASAGVLDGGDNDDASAATSASAAIVGGGVGRKDYQHDDDDDHDDNDDDNHSQPLSSIASTPTRRRVSGRRLAEQEERRGSEAVVEQGREEDGSDGGSGGEQAAFDLRSTPRTRNVSAPKMTTTTTTTTTTTPMGSTTLTSPCPKWSEALRSPRRDLFSPSKEMNKGGSLHGLGLIAAVDRAKRLSRCGKRCANLLADVAVLYDTFARSVLKSCSLLGPATDGSVGSGAAPPSPSPYPSPSTNFPPPIAATTTELRRSLVSFAKQTQGLSICVKGSVARPLHGSASAMADALPNIFNRYALTRAKCFSARQNAMKMRIRYVKAMREAECAVMDLKKARATATATTAATSAAASDDVPSLDNAVVAAAGVCSPTLKGGGPSDVASQDAGSAPDSPDVIKSPPPAAKDVGAAPIFLSKRTGWDDVKKKFVKQGMTQKSERVVKALDDVQLFEANYIALVEEENLAVSRSHTMEGMALEALQKMEEERLLFFVETLSRALQAEKGALDNMMLTLRRGSEESLASTLSTTSSNASQSMVPQNPSSLFVMRKASTSPQAEDGSAVNDALALSMSEEVGRWRDTQRRNLAAEASRIQAVKTFSAFFDEIASAALSFGSGLQARLANDGYMAKEKPKTSDAISSALTDFSGKTKTHETLASVFNDCEGKVASSCFSQVIKSLVECSKSATELGQSIQADGKKLFEKFASSERDYKIAVEAEEFRWRICCDASRELTRMKSRMEQSRSDLQKARQKLTSAEEDSQGNQKDSSMLKKNPTMTKALGNMFSILPEEAMTKMLAPDQRLAIVKRNVKEATAKEAKDTLAFEAASAAKEKAIASYISSAQSANTNSSVKAETLWSAVSVGVDVTVSFFQHFRESRYDSVDPATRWLQDNGKRVVHDMEHWALGVQRMLTKHSQKDEDGHRTPGRQRRRPANATAEDGYSLQVHLIDSKNVYKLIDLVTNESDGAVIDEGISPEQDVGEEIESQEQEPDGAVATEQNAREALLLEHGESTLSPTSLQKGKNLPASNDLRHPSSNTKELMSIASVLRDSSDRPIATEKAAESDATALTKPTKAEATTVASSKSAETELFLAHFWDVNENEGDSSSPPTVIDSFSCAYWPKEGEGFISPLLHGRLFITSSAMYFVGWGGKKLILKWEDVTAVAKATNMLGALDNSLRVTYDSGEGESSYFFGSFAFREDAFQIISRLSTVARSLKEIEGNKPAIKKDPPPDQILKKMEIVLKRKIKNVSVKRYYEKCWSEGNRTDAAPFYGPFLAEKKSHDVKVGDWEFADGKDGFENKWSGEKFPQKRVVSFKFTRTTHLYVGPPTAGVTQTQYCLVEDDDKCIIEMTVEMDGIPYADVFAVEVRWVARRVGNKDLLVEVGVFVDFKKSSMFASKIKSGTIQETKPVHNALFEAVKAACSAGPDEAEEGGEEEMEEEEAEKENVPEVQQAAFKQILSRVSAVISVAEMQAQISKVKKAGSALKETTSPEHVLLGLGIFFFLSLGWYILHASNKHYTSDDIIILSQQVDRLEHEMAEIKDLLREVLTVMKGGKK